MNSATTRLLEVEPIKRQSRGRLSLMRRPDSSYDHVDRQYLALSLFAVKPADSVPNKPRPLAIQVGTPHLSAAGTGRRQTAVPFTPRRECARRDLQHSGLA